MIDVRRVHAIAKLSDDGRHVGWKDAHRSSPDLARTPRHLDSVHTSGSFVTEAARSGADHVAAVLTKVQLR